MSSYFGNHHFFSWVIFYLQIIPISYAWCDSILSLSVFSISSFALSVCLSALLHLRNLSLLSRCCSRSFYLSFNLSICLFLSLLSTLSLRLSFACTCNSRNLCECLCLHKCVSTYVCVCTSINVCVPMIACVHITSNQIHHRVFFFPRKIFSLSLFSAP